MIDPVNKTPLTTGAGVKPTPAEQPAANSRSSSARRAASSPQETIALSRKAQFAHDVANAARGSDGVDNDRVRVVRAALVRNLGTVSAAEIAKAVSQTVWLLHK